MTKAAHLAALILAAGKSQRMGRLKPMLPLGDGCVLERVVGTFRAGGVDVVIVVTGHRAEALQPVLARLAVHSVANPDYRRGMFSSVQTGLRALPIACRAVFIHPVDIPLIHPQTVRRMAAAYFETTTAVLHPTFHGRRGHPTLIHRDLVPDILSWQGEGGLRAFLTGRATDSRELSVADEGILLDMDTVEDYRGLVSRLKRHPVPEC
jgi:CTP:molybdopterin cytidylyltransferase MocA